MAGRDHDAAIKIIHPGNVGNTGRSGDVEQIGICTGSGQACNQTILEHIGAAAGILTDDDTGRLIVAVTLAQSVVIPTQKTTNLIGMVSSQSDSSLTTKAISSKIFSHYSFSSSKE